MTINGPLVTVLTELKNGELKGVKRTALLSIEPNGRRKSISLLSDLLTNLNTTAERSFTSSVEVVWITPANLSECLTVLNAVKAFGIEYLALDDNGRVSNDPHMAKLRYMSFGVSPIKAYVADLRVISLDSITKVLTNKSLKLVYDALPFLGFLKHHHIVLNHVGDLRLLDILLLCGLGNLKPDLSDTILRHLDVKVSFPKLTHLLCRDDISAILTTQASYLFALAEKLYPKIRTEKLGNVVKLEMQCLYSLCDIQYNGMPFSVPMVQELSGKSLSERDAVSAQLHHHLDYIVATPDGPLSCTVNLDSAQQVLKALHRIGLYVPSTKESVLALYKSEHEVVTLLIRYKQLSYQIKHTGESYLRYLHPLTQRIHAKVASIGTRTGRIIITEPNTQGVKRGSNRKLFRAPEGFVFVTGDYKQIEVLIYAVLSKDPSLLEDCSSAEGVYIIIARMFLNLVTITPEDRKKIKPVVLGLLYDMTDSGLVLYSKGFGVEITMTEAAAWRGLFFNRYEHVALYQKKLAQKACAERSVESIAGRKRRFDTRSVIAERPAGLSFLDFNALIGSVGNLSSSMGADRAMYVVENENEAVKLQDQLLELNLNTTSEQCDPTMGVVYNGVAQMTCVDLIKTALAFVHPHLKSIRQIVNTSHDDMAFIVPEKDSPVFVDTLKNVMESASYELFKPHKAMVDIKIGKDYDM